MNKSKKLVSLALCLTLVFSVFACLGTMTASAATEAAGYRYLEYGITYWYSSTGTTGYTSGTGTAADPYIVTTAAQLRHLARGDANGAGKYYKLGNDIAINDTSYEDWYLRSGLTNWIKGKDSSGNNVSPTMNGRELGEFLFRSNFDGDGHTISGLYINYEGTGHMETSGTGYNRTAVGWALFPSVNGATIKNLKLKDVYIKSNVSNSCGNQPHGYGALIGYSYYAGATVSNVQIENVKYDIQSPNQAFTNYRVGVGSIIGYAGGPITATDCIVKNISGKAVNKYFTGSGKPGSAGSIIGFVAGESASYIHTLRNIISIGRMNPLSAGVADPAFVTTNTDTAIPLSMPIRSGSSATNVYAIGDVSILANSNITKAVDEATFKSTNLDTFYNNIGGSTNWSAKNVNEVPYLKSFPPVEDHKEKAADLICDFSDYTPSTSAKALSNWTVATESGNKVLKGDFTSNSLGANNFGFIVGSYTYGVHGALVPGKIYKMEFKAKADEAATMNYALYNGSTYAASSRDYHLVSGGYDAFGRRTASLSTEWQKYTTYFTFDSYTNTTDAYQGTKRPFFFVQPNNTIWGNSVYFDDVVITSCEGTSFAQSANHYYEPTLGYNGDDVTLIADPEKENYIFDGWYTDAECTEPFDSDTVKVSDGLILYESWEEAATEMFYDPIAVEEAGAGTYSENLYTRVTSANAYPINLDIENNGGEVVLGFATASEDDFGTAKSVIWQKTIPAGSRTVSLLLEPNTVREDGVKGDTLYVFVRYTNGAEVSIDNFEMIDAPTSRTVEFDVNADDALDILDLLRLKKMSLLTTDVNWLGDLDGDGFAAQSNDLVAVRKALLGISDVVTEKMGRTLVWNEEFDGTTLNSDTFAIKYSLDNSALIGSQEADNLRVADGKLNMNVTRFNSTAYKVPFEVMTKDKMSFNKGYIEMSAKMNLSGGQWASYWLSALDNGNKYRGEMDIFETTASGFKPNVHSWENGLRKAQLGDSVTRFAVDDNFDTTAYHTYGFEWDNSYLKFYIDGTNYYTVITSFLGDEYDGIFDQYYFLLLGNIVYTNQDGEITADDALPRMSIDYVRLYQKDGELLTIGS